MPTCPIARTQHRTKSDSCADATPASSPRRPPPRIFGTVKPLPNLEQTRNMAPARDAPVVRQARDGERHLDALKWGLAPISRRIRRPASQSTPGRRPSPVRHSRVHPTQLKQRGRYASYATLAAYIEEESDLFADHAPSGPPSRLPAACRRATGLANGAEVTARCRNRGLYIIQMQRAIVWVHRSVSTT